MMLSAEAAPLITSSFGVKQTLAGTYTCMHDSGHSIGTARVQHGHSTGTARAQHGHSMSTPHGHSTATADAHRTATAHADTSMKVSASAEGSTVHSHSTQPQHTATAHGHSTRPHHQTHSHSTNYKETDRR